MAEFIDKIKEPAHLRAVSEDKIPALCEEYRAFLIKNAKTHGGHLASNLGVVELTVAMHPLPDHRSKTFRRPVRRHCEDLRIFCIRH